MSELSARETAPFIGAKAALWLALLLVSGVALVAALGVANRPRVGALEHFEETTAVGDTAYLPIPQTAQKPPAAVANWNGQPLYPVSFKKIELHDTKMIRAGLDPVSGLTIYRSAVPVPPQEGEREKKGEPFYFLKMGPGQYVKVRSWTPGM